MASGRAMKRAMMRMLMVFSWWGDGRDLPEDGHRF